uniref:Uncharacterized protein n=1 Tax=Anguilla anguilla TaxID=7936 RepID=A0A0E9RIH4_ANGAN
MIKNINTSAYVISYNSITQKMSETNCV